MNFSIKKAVTFVLVFLMVSCTKRDFYLSIQTKKNLCQGVILGFINNTQKLGLEYLLTEALTVELIKKGYKLKEPTIVKSLLSPEEQIGYYENPDTGLSAEVMKRLGNYLDIKWIIGGRILKAEKVGEYVVLEVLMWIKDTEEGRLIWYGYYKKDSDAYRTVFHFGKTNNFNSLIGKMVKRDIIRDVVKTLNCEKNV